MAVTGKIQYNFRKLTALDSSLALFTTLTFSGLRDAVTTMPPHHIAVGLFTKGQPIGLAFGALLDHEIIRLHSIMVKPAFRNQGLGTALLMAWEKEVALAGHNLVECFWTSRLKNRPFLENTLLGAGWSKPHVARMVCWCDADKTARAETEQFGLRAVGRIRKKQGLSYCPWQTRDADDVRAILCNEDVFAHYPSGAVADMVDFDQIDANVSFTIRASGALVGWAVSGKAPHRCLPPMDYVHATWLQSVWIEPKLAQSGLATVAIQASAQAVVRTYGPGGLLGYDTVEPRVIAMTQNRFLPFVVDGLNVYSVQRKLMSE